MKHGDEMQIRNIVPRINTLKRAYSVCIEGVCNFSHLKILKRAAHKSVIDITKGRNIVRALTHMRGHSHTSGTLRHSSYSGTCLVFTTFSAYHTKTQECIIRLEAFLVTFPHCGVTMRPALGDKAILQQCSSP